MRIFDKILEFGVRCEVLNELLNDMDIPLMRRELNSNNLRWLQRNLGINNHNHPNFGRAMSLIQDILKELK